MKTSIINGSEVSRLSVAIHDDDLICCIDKYDEVFHVDVSVMNYEKYYPWFHTWFFRKWFTDKPVKQISKPLTVRMFAESAKAGKWLYD
ncbi:Protein of uncharacterised function (DUF1493) [Raoultella terrigena]|uniref:Protein of uncharacterized function (DUF1493) n=1 Tax=Raoultella terrigena TaxID=577 RepID=A0A4U9CZY6_RAOTE|nr:Protein of uncharacterised function (DUF1493) [Raoultella terrigena]